MINIIKTGSFPASNYDRHIINWIETVEYVPELRKDTVAKEVSQKIDAIGQGSVILESIYKSN